MPGALPVQTMFEPRHWVYEALEYQCDFFHQKTAGAIVWKILTGVG
jgi:hypothetical protein